jgi:hypothetical protein
MCVKVTLYQRLGNNLFQYAFGRIVAEHHGLALICRQIRYSYSPQRLLSGQSDAGPAATLEALAEYFPNAPLFVPGRIVDEPVERHEVSHARDRSDEWDGHILDLDAMLADRTPRQICLGGFFQRYEYFQPYRERIREWFRPHGVSTPWRIEPKDVVVNIRRGADYGIENWALAMSYYERIVDGLQDRGRVYVCGVGVDGAVRQHLARFDPIYYDATAIEHFAFMMRFNRIVLSNSTFAWWAAFMSDAEEIYAPRSVDGKVYGFTGWQEQNVDLRMHEPRYIEVVDTPIARFSPFTVRADAAVVATLDAASRELWTWISQQRGPISILDMLSTHRHLNVRKAVYDLTAAGLVSPEVTYLEDASRAPSSAPASSVLT